MKAKSFEYILYLTGLVIAGFTLIGVLIFTFTPLDILHFFPKCAVKSITGLYCPGCGGTRAVKALFTGHILKYLYFHPVVPYCAVIYAVFMVRGTIAFITKEKYHYMKYSDIYVYIAVAIIIIQCIIKNYLLIAKGISII